MAVNKVVMNTQNGEETLIDLTEDTVTPETLAEGTTAHDASGAIIVGTATPVVPGQIESNPLYGKKVSFLGDSICAGADTEDSYLGGYGKIIADRNNMVYENLAAGGALVTAETYTSQGYPKTWLCRSIQNMSADADYAIIEGGYNDSCHSDDFEIGSLSVGYTAELDDTTYYGAFESMLKQLVTRFKGKKVGYIAVPAFSYAWDSSTNVPNFYHIALECCAKWGVSVCDLNKLVPPQKYIPELANEYTGDGVHPNYEGYLKYYCDPIEAWMKTLTTTADNSVMIARKMVDNHADDKNAHEDIRALLNDKLSKSGLTFKRAKLPLADGTTIEIDVLTSTNGTLVIPYVNQVPISIDADGNVFNDCGYLGSTRLSSSGATKACTNAYVTGYIPAKNGDVIRIYGCGWATTTTAMNYICAYDADFNFIGGKATQAGSTLVFSTYSTSIFTECSADASQNATITLACPSTVAYIRVSFYSETAVGTDMIVTVNEEIE